MNRHKVARVVLGVSLVAFGWSLGRAQTTEPDFEIRVDAPAGATVIECVRGCELSWVQRGVSPNSQAQPSFNFKCGGAAVERCGSGRVGGWIKR